MKINYTLLAMVFATTFCYGQKTTKQTQTAKDEASIRKHVTEVYGSKVNANDAASYANELFADDVLWAPPDAPDRTDKAGIQAGMQNTFDKFTLGVQPTVEEIKVYEEFAYAIGNVDVKLTPKAGGDIVPVKFRIFWILTKQANGKWLISRQIWNKKPING